MQIEEENLTDESTDVRCDSTVQKYETRPMEPMVNVKLADFATGTHSSETANIRRDVPRILLCKHYDTEEIDDYKREMELL
jgi:hypothetical protein